jgi:hypothetical protein
MAAMFPALHFCPFWADRRNPTGGKSFVHLFAEAADLNAQVADLMEHLGAEAAELIAYVGAEVLAFLFDETRKLLEPGLLFFGMWARVSTAQ